MSTKQTEALKQALKRAFNLGQTYWQQADSEYTSQWKKADVTLASFNQLLEDTIQEALAEQREQQQEPVAWLYPDNLGRKIVKLGAKKPIIARPDTAEPLYTSPQPSKPLTDEQIDAIWDAVITPSNHIREFARAIEAAHGIKEKP